MLQSNLLLFLESKRMEIRENRAKSDESKKSEASSKRKPLLHSSRCEHRRSSMNRTRKESLERVERREIAIALTRSPTIFEQCVYTHALRTPQPRTFIPSESRTRISIILNALHFSLSFVSFRSRDRSRTIPYHLLLRVYVIKPWHEHEISRYAIERRIRR